MWYIDVGKFLRLWGRDVLCSHTSSSGDFELIFVLYSITPSSCHSNQYLGVLRESFTSFNIVCFSHDYICFYEWSWEILCIEKKKSSQSKLEDFKGLSFVFKLLVKCHCLEHHHIHTKVGRWFLNIIATSLQMTQSNSLIDLVTINSPLWTVISI